MKGIVLAGGAGTRLFPVTRAVSKQLLPIYDKPMVYYALSTLMTAGVRDLLVISTPRDLPLFQRLLGDGSAWGVSFAYAEQAQPRGIADALLVGRSFLADEPVGLVLGDNLFLGAGLGDVMARAVARPAGASVFAYEVRDPERYGVVTFDDGGVAVSLEEKPVHPQSNFAVTGLYFYDGRASGFAEELRPSARGEIEITDLNRRYLELGELYVEKLDRGYAWLDTGTHDSLSEASDLIRALEHRQGVKISCPEEIAFRQGWIDSEQIARLGRDMGGTEYGAYLSSLVATAR